VNNSPINFSDPTGHDSYSSCGGNPACIDYVDQNPEADFTSNWGSGSGGGGDPDDELDNDDPAWEEIAEPGDEFIAYTINGENYWASCRVYSLGRSCTSSITYNLDGREALSLLLALKYNFYPNPEFLQKAASDTGSLLLSKGFPPYEGMEKLYDWYEFANKDTLSNAFDALGNHMLLNNLGGDGPAYIPPVSVTFTKGLGEIRPLTPFENFVSPGGGGTFHGSYAGVVMTITNTDPSISTSVYLGEQSGYLNGFDTLLEVTRLLSE
jgi:hypothetical protein